MNEATEIKYKHNAIILEKTAAALNHNGFHAVVARNATEAREWVMKLGAGAKTVGFGGSLTINELDIPAQFKAAGAELLIHSRSDLTPAERLEIMRRQQTCDLFVMSTNAITMEGFLVNVDGAGNRIAALIFGPKRVVVVVGVNKIVETEGDAYHRVEVLAAPMNAERLNKNTPCRASGWCEDCDTTDRICRAFLTLRRSPSMSEIHVILVNQELGL
jgi:L-lactate utilization protein LutB